MKILSPKEVKAIQAAVQLQGLDKENKNILAQMLDFKVDTIHDAELYVDGASDLHSKTAGIGGVIYVAGKEIFSFSEPLVDKTNNEAEYLSMIQGLKVALELNIATIIIYSDSELIVKQVKGEYKLKNERMRALNQKVYSYLNQFAMWSVSHIRREKNTRADELSKMGMMEAKNSKK